MLVEKFVGSNAGGRECMCINGLHSVVGVPTALFLQYLWLNLKHSSG